MNLDFEKYMKLALEEAQKAMLQNEVPVGAVLVDQNGKILSKSHNLKEKLTSVLGHAEILCLHRSQRKKEAWRLNNCSLFVTLEPCIMCAGAIIQSRVEKVIYATPDPKGGAFGSLYDIHRDARLNHQVEVVQGPFQQEAADLLRQFFKRRRLEKKLNF